MHMILKNKHDDATIRYYIKQHYSTRSEVIFCTDTNKAAVVAE